MAIAAVLPRRRSRLMAGCIGNVDLDLLGRDFMSPCREVEQRAANDDEDDDQQKYGSRHRAFRLVKGMRGFCPTFAPAV